MPTNTLHRFPLPAHAGIPHEAEDCGDPEYCLHDTTERAFVQIRLIPEQATAVLVSRRAEQAKLALPTVRLDLLVTALIQAGVPKVVARSTAIMFHHPDDVALADIDSGSQEFNQKIIGWYDPTQPESTSLDETGRPRTHRLTIHLVLGPSVDLLNANAWHESGHAARHHTGHYHPGRQPLYRRPRLIRGLRLFTDQAETLLWRWEPEERFSEAFAARHRHLPLIS